MTAEQKIGQLLFRSVRGELNLEEKRELDTWRTLSWENEHLYYKLSDPEIILHDLGKRWSADPEMKKEIDQYFSSHSKKMTAILHRRIVYIPGIAAAVVTLLGIILYFVLPSQPSNPLYQANMLDPAGISLSMTDMRNGEQVGESGATWETNANGETVFVVPHEAKASLSKYFHINIPAGKRFIIRFSDGTLVYLNEKTRLSFPSNCSRGIKLFIHGEAYIEAGYHPDGNLRIITDSMQIHASATHLNLKNDPVRATSYVTNINGKFSVDVDSLPGVYKKTVTLYSGQQLELNHGSDRLIEGVDLKAVTGWRNPNILKLK